MKYERLTKRINNDIVSYVKPLKSNSQSALEEEICNKSKEVMFRLAELEDKIENGTLIEVPCKVGDEVYKIHSLFKEIDKWEITSIQIFDNDTFFRLGHKGTDDYAAFWAKEIGQYIFLTKEEAEKRLDELRV